MSESDIVREWLKYLGLDRYYDNFVDNGYDDLEMCKQIGDPDLDAIGVTELDHRLTIHRAVKTLLEKGGTSVYISIEEFSKIRDDISKSHNISPENAKHRKYFGSRHSDPKESGFHPETIGEQLTPSPLEAAIADILESKGVHFNNDPSANKDGLQVELDFLATEIQRDLPSGKNIAQTDIIEVLERIRRRGVTSGKSSSLPRDCPTKPWSSHPGDWHPSQHRSASSLLSFSRFLNSNSRSMDKDLNITARKESGDFRKELKKKAGFGKLFRSLSTSQTSPKHMSKTDILKQNSDTDRSLSMPQKPGEGQLKMVNFPEKNFIGKACHTHFAGEAPKSKKNKNKMIKELGRAMSWSSREIKEKEKKNYVSLAHSDESNSGNVGNSPRGDTHSALPSKVQPAQRPTSFFRTSNHMFDGYSCMSIKRRSGAEEAPTDTCRGDCGNIMCGLSPVKLDESAQQDCYRKLSSIEKPGSDDKEVDIDIEFCPRRRTKSESCCSSNRRNIYNVDTLSTNLMCARDRSSDGYSSYPASDASTVNEGFCTVVCQAVALVDYLPNPYDKDSLTLKKGDIVDILAKFDSGYWIGRSGDKIGHVKFVNLKEVDAYERNRDADLTSPSSLQEKLLTLEDFLEQLGLANYLNIFVMNGYHNINSLKLITKQDLVDMKIDDTERQEMLLSAVKQLKERNPEHDRCNCCTYLAPCKSMERRNFFRNMDPNNPSPEYFSSGTACSHSHFLEKRNDDLERSSVLENVKFYSSDRLCSKDSCHGPSDPDNFRSERAVPDRDTVNDLGDNFKKSCHIESERANNVQKVTESVPDFRRNTSNLNIPPYQSSLESTHCGSNAIIISKENSFDTIQSQNENRTYPTKAIARPYGTITLDEFLESRRKMASEEEEPIVDEQVQFPVSKRDFLSRFSRNGSWLNKAENDVHPQDRKSKSILGYRKLSLKSPISEISASADALDFVTLPRAKKSSVEDMRLATCDAFYYRTERKSKRRMRRKKDRSKSSTISSPQSYTLQDLVGQKLRDEDIDLCSEPYTDKTGFCGIPPALVQRYADELQQDIFDIAEALDHERMYLLQNQGKAAVPNDFLADSCCEPVIVANYSSLSDWLISIGLPIYEKTLSKAGYSELYHIADLTDREMRHCGIHNDRHVRLLKTAIEALHIQFEHHGYIT